MRWVAAKVIGDGASVATAFRSAAARHGDHAALIPGKDDGTPLSGWCLSHLRNGENDAAADPDCVLLPPPDSHVITAAEARSLNGELARLGCPPGLIVAGVRSDAAALVLGRSLDAAFELGWLNR